MATLIKFVLRWLRSIFRKKKCDHRFVYDDVTDLNKELSEVKCCYCYKSFMNICIDEGRRGMFEWVESEKLYKIKF